METMTTNYKKIYVGDPKLDKKTINKLIGIEEDYQAPERMYEIVLNKDKREAMFDKFLAIETDLSYDWFRKYFEQVQAERKSQKQDFTPDSISNILFALTNVGAENKIYIDAKRYYEPGVGTGSIFVNNWYQDKTFDPVGNSIRNNPNAYPQKWANSIKSAPVGHTYRPSSYFYALEDKSEAVIPFLLFNMSIRGVNGIVLQADSLTRECKHAYYTYNEKDKNKYSDITELPHNDDAKAFIKSEGLDVIWTDKVQGDKNEWK